MQVPEEEWLPHCPNGGKIMYPTERDARIALVGIFVRKNAGAPNAGKRKERRPYTCPHCHAWHLSSQA